MADYSIVEYAASGTPGAQYVVPYDFISRDHVQLLTGYDKSTGAFSRQLVAGTDYRWANDTKIEAVALDAGTRFAIVRSTPRDQPLVNWLSGAGALTAEELRLASLQLLYVVQENIDRGMATAADADDALKAVSSVVAYTPVTNGAAIPVDPADNTYIEVMDSTGLEGFMPLTGVPAGFVGDPGLRVRLRYEHDTPTWVWIDYAAKDPEGRYIKQSAITTSTNDPSTQKVAAAAAVKATMDVAAEARALAAAAMPKAGGVFAGNIDAPSLNSGPLAGFRNAVINGGFNFWQRGITGNAAGYAAADRWNVSRAGSTFTMSRQSFALGQVAVPGEPAFFCRMEVASVAGAANNCILEHRIEGVRSYAGRQITISFYAKADAAKSISVELLQNFGTGGSPSARVQGIAVTKKALTTNWQLVTVTAALPSISGKVLGSDGNDNLSLAIWLDAGSNYNARTDSLGQQSGIFDFSQVQIEPGPISTPFERRPLGMELALCQRYHQLGDFSHWAYGLANNGVGMSVNFPAVMRAAPVVLISRTNATNISTVTVQQIWPTGFGVIGNPVANGATYFERSYVASCEL